MVRWQQFRQRRAIDTSSPPQKQVSKSPSPALLVAAAAVAIAAAPPLVPQDRTARAAEGITCSCTGPPISGVSGLGASRGLHVRL
jgi:hypothetical protein